MDFVLFRRYSYREVHSEALPYIVRGGNVSHNRVIV